MLMSAANTEMLGEGGQHLRARCRKPSLARPLAPVARTASTWLSSISSIASYKSSGAEADRAQRDRQDTGEHAWPIMVTSISAQISD